jgi:hypothetical protein
MVDGNLNVTEILKSYLTNQVQTIRETRSPITLFVAVVGIFAFAVTLIAVVAIAFGGLDPLVLDLVGLLFILALVVVVVVLWLIIHGYSPQTTYTNIDNRLIAMVAVAPTGRRTQDSARPWSLSVVICRTRSGTAFVASS